MNTKDTSAFLKKPVLSALVFFGTSIVLSVTYAAYQVINTSEYDAGAPVTSSLMGKIVGNIDNLNTRLTSAEATITSQAATITSMSTTISTLSPSWAVMAFNLATCPTGWTIADGGGGRPDLRGEFIRGLDNGRGVDAGRVLKSAQKGSLVMNTSGNTDTRSFSLVANGSIYQNLFYDPAQLNPANNAYGYAQATAWVGIWWAGVDGNYVGATRPRNVALLYCVKN